MNNFSVLRRKNFLIIGRVVVVPTLCQKATSCRLPSASLYKEIRLNPKTCFDVSGLVKSHSLFNVALVMCWFAFGFDCLTRK